MTQERRLWSDGNAYSYKKFYGAEFSILQRFKDGAVVGRKKHAEVEACIRERKGEENSFSM
jgi:hypothetical protein